MKYIHTHIHTDTHTYKQTSIHACMHIYMHAYIHTYILACMHAYIFVVVNFDALAQASDIRIEGRQVVFLCWRQDSNPEGLRHLFASRLNACWQTDWAIEDQAKNLNSTARPHDQQAFGPPDPTAIWHSHLAQAIYIFVVVNFDALAQASDIRIERVQVVFLCLMHFDSNLEGNLNRNNKKTAYKSLTAMIINFMNSILHRIVIKTNTWDRFHQTMVAFSLIRFCYSKLSFKRAKNTRH